MQKFAQSATHVDASIIIGYRSHALRDTRAMYDVFHRIHARIDHIVFAA